MPKKPSKKQIDREIDSLYKIHAQGRTINIMDIGKVFKMGHDAVAAGLPLEPAIVAAVARFTMPA